MQKGEDDLGKRLEAADQRSRRTGKNFSSAAKRMKLTILSRSDKSNSSGKNWSKSLRLCKGIESHLPNNKNNKSAKIMTNRKAKPRKP